MKRRVDIFTRTVAALTLALLLVVPVAGPACAVELPAPPAAAVDCATLCEQAGRMPIDCVEGMADGNDCGDMLPAPSPAEDEPVVSTSPQQAPATTDAAPPVPVLGDGSDLLTPLRASRADRPPLDPLGVRIRI